MAASKKASKKTNESGHKPEEPKIPKQASAESLDRRAKLLLDEGDDSAAVRLLREALKLRKKTLGLEHQDTIDNLSQLAFILLTTGDYEAAEPLLRQTLSLREKTLGPEHPESVSCLNNLALLLNNIGDYDAAEPLFRRALEIRERTLGDEDPATARSMNALAATLMEKDELDAAEPLFRRALAVERKVLGQQHPDTCMSLDNLGLLLERKGDSDGAEKSYRRALKIREKALGTEHPETAISLHNLAGLLNEKSEFEAAKELERRALVIRETALGGDHPDTANSLSLLASILYNQSMCDTAEAGQWEIVPVARMVADADRLGEAEMLQRRALEIREESYGLDHPWTITSLDELTETLRVLDRTPDANNLLSRGDFLAIMAWAKAIARLRDAPTLEAVHVLAALLFVERHDQHWGPEMTRVLPPTIRSRALAACAKLSINPDRPMKFSTSEMQVGRKLKQLVTSCSDAPLLKFLETLPEVQK